MFFSAFCDDVTDGTSDTHINDFWGVIFVRIVHLLCLEFYVHRLVCISDFIVKCQYLHRAKLSRWK